MAKKKKKSKRNLPRLLGAGALFSFAAAMLMLAWLLWGMPSLDDVKPLNLQPSITILASDDAIIARYGGMRGDMVTIKSLPKYVTQSLLAVEDRRFYSHFGIDPLGLARAMFTNLKALRWVQGGSTITQQLAKNLFLTPDKTLRRKGQEALMALMIERRFSKDAILEAYLNRVYFGAGAYGIDAAALTYFGKAPQKLDLWESAVLAGLLKAPSRYSPQAHPERAATRAKVVIHAMREAGYIDALTEKVYLNKKKIPLASHASGDLGRYFSDWIISLLDGFMAESNGDITVRTTFNPALQHIAEAATKTAFDNIKPEDKISQVALVTMAQDGAVLAMIGGRDYSASQFNRATQAQRQPGSAFKPFVYLAALEAGYSPSSTILDAPFIDGKYRPDNYDGKYHGNVPLVDALALSLNTATVRLLQDVGIPRLLDVARRAGFGKKLMPELATALGTNETTPLALTNAFAMIANGGKGIWPYAILSIEDKHGGLIYKRDGAEFAQAFAQKDAAALGGMLQQVVNFGTGRAAALNGTQAAGKTGTSQNYRDAWFVGYAGAYVTGVWMGNDDNTEMHRITGGNAPARLWRDYMNGAVGQPVPAFVEMRGMRGSGSPGESFMRFLNNWSSGDFAPDNTPPTYNR